jgi:molybdate transport system ATP-binding protein
MVLISDARVPVNRRKTLSIERFAIRPGEHWCVLGGNGSGKTSLVKLLRGELVRGRQHVAYAEHFDPATDLDTVSFEEQQRLWSLDDRHDISEYSVEAQDQGTTVARLISPPANPAVLQLPQVQEMLSALQLSELLERGIRYLSSGQVRKAMIARARRSPGGDRQTGTASSQIFSATVDGRHQCDAVAKPEGKRDAAGDYPPGNHARSQDR